MKRRIKYIVCSLLILCIFSATAHAVYANEKKPPNISAAKNGTVTAVKYSQDKYSTVYKITMTPKKGYIIGPATIIYKKTKDPSEVNPAQFEEGGGRSQIWYYRLEKDIKQIKITFRKNTNPGTLSLVPEKTRFSYHEKVRIQIRIKDSKGRPVKPDGKEQLYLYGPVNFESVEKAVISKDGLIELSPSYFSGETETVLKAVIYDARTGLYAAASDIKIKLGKAKAQVGFLNLEQTEGNVSPVAALCSIEGQTPDISYRIPQDGAYIWVHDVPVWEGTYAVKAFFQNNSIVQDMEADAELVIKAGNEKPAYQTEELLLLDRERLYLKLIVADNQLTVQTMNGSSVPWKYSVRLRNEQLLQYGDAGKGVSNYDLGAFPDGRYQLMLSGEQLDFPNVFIGVNKGKAFLLQPAGQQQNEMRLKADSLVLQHSVLDKLPENYHKIAQTAEEATAGISTDSKKAKAIYQWIMDNLYFDEDTYRAILNGSSKSIKPQDALSVLESRLGVSEGFSNLYRVMLQSVGIRSITMSGLAGGDVYNMNSVTTGLPHTWNLVYCKDLGRSILADTAWGSGNFHSGGYYHQTSSKDFYFDITWHSLSLTHIFSAPSVPHNSN